MKKLISLVLCLLLLPSAFALEISLPEKMEVQLTDGSGFRANYSLFMGPVSVQEKDYFTGHYTYINDGVTEEMALYDADEKLLIQANQSLDGKFVQVGSDLLHIVDDKGKIRENIVNAIQAYLNLPATLTTILRISGYKHAYQMETPLLAKRRRDEVAEMLSEYQETLQGEIDLWLQNFLTAKDNTALADGTQLMGFEYRVPVEEAKAFIKRKIADIAKDTLLLEALQESMPYEYASLFLHFSDSEFIHLAIDALPIEGDIAMGRTFSLKGKPVSTYVEFPFYDALSGEMSLKYSLESNLSDNIESQSFSLVSEESSFELKWNSKTEKQVSEYDGTLRVLSKNQEKSHALKFQASLTQDSYVDDESKDREDFILQVDVLNDTEFLAENSNYSSMDELDFRFSQSYSSGAAKNASTHRNVDIDILNLSKKQLFKLSIQAKTAVPWSIERLVTDKVSQLNFEFERDYQTAMEKLAGVLLSKSPSFVESSFFTFLKEILGMVPSENIALLEEDSDSQEETSVETESPAEETEMPVEESKDLPDEAEETAAEG